MKKCHKLIIYEHFNCVSVKKKTSKNLSACFLNFLDLMIESFELVIEAFKY